MITAQQASSISTSPKRDVKKPSRLMDLAPRLQQTHVLFNCLMHVSFCIMFERLKCMLR
ncbi:hypothetical protein Hanom_Chr17g01574521 [Helianthus anomalus]